MSVQIVTTPNSTRALAVNSREIVFNKFRLEVVEGPDRGIHVISSGDELTVGSERGNDLCLTDPAVSRHHCVVRVNEDGVLVRDLGSTNGTTLGEYRVESAFLNPGARLRLGSSVLRFDVLSDEIRERLSELDRFGPMLGVSTAMRRVFALLERMAVTDSTVLLEGETGTGKELAAEAIREASARGAGPFIVVDCGAIPPTLIESELFGHVRGAFTDAREDRCGAFEMAHGGTIFLDEVGELPLEMQPKLLRVLEKGSVRRVGSDRVQEVNVRIIAATNRDLRAEVNRGGFRPDLFYRLNVLRVRIPPLRERREDIPLLVAHFYSDLAGAAESLPPPELVTELARHSWPGNVRELRAAVQRAVVLGNERWRDEDAELGGAPVARESADTFRFDVPFREAKEEAVSHWERDYLATLLEANLGNLSRAARQVQMDRNYLRELLRKHGIDRS
jgi:DNA-binding NtrC family response regulator